MTSLVTTDEAARRRRRAALELFASSIPDGSCREGSGTFNLRTAKLLAVLSIFDDQRAVQSPVPAGVS